MKSFYRTKRITQKFSTLIFIYISPSIITFLNDIIISYYNLGTYQTLIYRKWLVYILLISVSCKLSRWYFSRSDTAMHETNQRKLVNHIVCHKQSISNCIFSFQMKFSLKSIASFQSQCRLFVSILPPPPNLCQHSLISGVGCNKWFNWSKIESRINRNPWIFRNG